MSEYQELITDVILQMHIFARPSDTNVKKMIKAIKELEQQLKTAKESYASIGNYDLPIPDDIKDRFQVELFYRGAYAMRDKIIQEYANNIEGK